MGLEKRRNDTYSALFGLLCLVPTAQAEDSAELAKKALNPMVAIDGASRAAVLARQPG